MHRMDKPAARLQDRLLRKAAGPVPCATKKTEAHGG